MVAAGGNANPPPQNNRMLDQPQNYNYNPQNIRQQPVQPEKSQCDQADDMITTIATNIHQFGVRWWQFMSSN
jgi:hypothetical protein